MKKLIFFLFIILSFNAYSQSPSNFTYQSVVRDGSGKLLSNKEISFRISVLKNSESGQVVFEEEHSVTTNINGLATLIVGKGSGNDDLGGIDWGDGSYFLKVEIDPEGGFNFIAEDTTQLLSVPYALYSSSSGSSLTITGQDYLTISNNEITVNQIDLSDDVVGILPIVNGGTGSSTAPMVGVITAADAASARNVLGLSTVASSGSYNDLTDKLTAGTNIDITNGVISSTDTNTEYTAGTNIDITNGVISSTDTNTEYTAGTGISIDGNNAISSTITQYTDANAQAAFTAGTNIDITNGVISSTDTNTQLSTSDVRDKFSAGEGIVINNGEISGEDATSSNKGIASFSTDNFDVSSGAVIIKDGGVANDELAGSIADSKLNQITTSNKVAGSSVQLASGSALANSSGLDVTVDDSSIENNSGTLRVKADGISNSMIADPELKEFAAMTPASTGQYNFIAGTGDNFQALTVPETLTALGAGTMATQNKESVNIDGGEIELSALNIDGGTDIGEALADADLFIVDNGADGTNRKATMSRLKTYVQSGSVTSLNDLSDVLIDTYSYYIGNIPANRNSANYNYASGHSALDALTTGDANLAIGYEALKSNTSGGYNTALGTYALQTNTTPSNNTAVGSRALMGNETGIDNTAVGNDALYSNNSGSYNTAVGKMALKELDNDGNFNTALGNEAGDQLTVGDNNIMIGYDANASSQGAINQIVIGNGARGEGNNYAVIGNDATERLYAAEDAGAVVYAGGLNLSGSTTDTSQTISGILSGSVTMSTSASQAFTVSGVTSNSIVTASFKSGDNGRYIKTVVPSTDTITITLDNPADGGVIMYIVIN